MSLLASSPARPTSRLDALKAAPRKPGEASFFFFDAHFKTDTVKVLPGDERMNYKPSVDITFASAANVYHDQVLAVVLTGMGADGCEGARLLKQQGATVWSQDEATSVIYGMPMAVAKAGLSDEVLPLPQIGPRLADIH